MGFENTDKKTLTFLALLKTPNGIPTFVLTQQAFTLITISLKVHLESMGSIKRKTSGGCPAKVLLVKNYGAEGGGHHAMHALPGRQNAKTYLTLRAHPVVPLSVH